MRRLTLLIVVLPFLTACGQSNNPTDAFSGPPASDEGGPDWPPVQLADCDLLSPTTPDGPLTHFVGSQHLHSSYSDGDIDTIPADYFAAIEGYGLDYAASSEHSDTLDAGVFIAVGDGCFETPDGFATCFLSPSDDRLQKWTATAEQVAAATHEDFLAIRGFEWTSDRFGHINVYFSQNFTNAKMDGGYLATLETFWDWFTRAPDSSVGLGGAASSPVPFGGGSDALAHFNHPGDKCLDEADVGCDWNGYEFIPEAAERMFGIEVNNRNRHRYTEFWVRALDAGWWLAPTSSEDEHGTLFGAPERPKTVTVAGELTNAGFREAWLARRVYALSSGYQDLRIEVSINGEPMGARLACADDAGVDYRIQAIHADGRPFDGTIRLISNEGVEVASASGPALMTALPVTDRPRWYAAIVQPPDTEQEDGTLITTDPAAYAAPVELRRRETSSR